MVLDCAILASSLLRWMLAHAKVWLSHWLMGALSAGAAPRATCDDHDEMLRPSPPRAADAQARGRRLADVERTAFQAADMAAQMEVRPVPVSDDGPPT